MLPIRQSLCNGQNMIDDNTCIGFCWLFNLAGRPAKRDYSKRRADTSVLAQWTLNFTKTWDGLSLSSQFPASSNLHGFHVDE